MADNNLKGTDKKFSLQELNFFQFYLLYLSDIIFITYKPVIRLLNKPATMLLFDSDNDSKCDNAFNNHFSYLLHYLQNYLLRLKINKLHNIQMIQICLIRKDLLFQDDFHLYYLNHINPFSYFSSTKSYY